MSSLAKAISVAMLFGAVGQNLPTMVATAGGDQASVTLGVKAFAKMQGGFGLSDHGKTFVNYEGAGHDRPEEWHRPEIARDIAAFVKKA